VWLLDLQVRWPGAAGQRHAVPDHSGAAALPRAERAIGGGQHGAVAARLSDDAGAHLGIKDAGGTRLARDYLILVAEILVGEQEADVLEAVIPEGE
jgi:hypothetical protein